MEIEQGSLSDEKIFQLPNGWLHAPRYKGLDARIDSSYEVFDNLADMMTMRRFYSQIAGSLERNHLTIVWFMGQPGSGKSLSARQFTVQADRDQKLRSMVLAKTNMHLVVKHLTFEECVYEAKLQRSALLNQGGSDQIHAEASCIMENTIFWMEQNYDSPALLTIETPFFSYPVRDLGGTVMMRAVRTAGWRDKDTHFAIAIIPDETVKTRARRIREALSEENLKSIESVDDRQRLIRLQRSMARVETGEQIRNITLDLIDQLIEEGELPAILHGFRDDYSKEMSACYHMYDLQCLQFLGKRRRKYLVLPNYFLPADIVLHRYDEIFDTYPKPHVYSLPVHEIAELVLKIARLTPRMAVDKVRVNP